MMLHVENLTPNSFQDGKPIPVAKPHVRVRQRKQLSCIQCHRQKLKCDRGLPCSRCIHSGRKEQCGYKAASARRLQEVSPHGKSMESDDGVEQSSVSTAQSDGATVLHGLSSDTHSNNSTESPHTNMIRRKNDLSKSETPGAQPVYLRYKDGKVEFKVPTHWAFLASQFGDLTPFLFGKPAGFELISDRLKSCKLFYKLRRQRSRNYPFSDGRGEHVQFIQFTGSIISILPSRDIVESFVENYILTFEGTHRLLHIPTFKTELARFWEVPQGVEDDWLAQLFMILALGCPRGRREEDASLVDMFLDGAETYLSRTPFLYKPNMTTLRTMCMMVIAKHIDIVSIDDSDAGWSFMGLILRLAMASGLHRDPGYLDGMPMLERQMRKRMWTTIVFLDIQNSFESGMPLLLKSSDFDAPPPDNLNDDDISNLIGQIEPRSPDEFTDSTYQSLLARSFPVAFKVISLVNSPACTMESTKVLALNTEVRALLREADRLFNRAENNGPEHSRWIVLQKMSAEMYYRRMLLALHRQYTQIPNAVELHPESYWGSLECSFAMIILQHKLDEDFNDGSLVWFAELFKGEFFISALYVAKGLWRNDFNDQRNDLFQLPEKQTVTIALKSCLDIWEKKIVLSLDHFKNHLMLAMVIHGLEARNTGMPLLAAMSEAAESNISAVQRAFTV